jgi:hypothetical protein
VGASLWHPGVTGPGPLWRPGPVDAALYAQYTEETRKAQTRAQGLLRQLIGAESWRQFENEGSFTELIAGVEYVIKPGHMITVRKGHRAERWCVNPARYTDDGKLIPSEDQAIAQLLHLRADPAKLRELSNIYQGAH